MPADEVRARRDLVEDNLATGLHGEDEEIAGAARAARIAKRIEQRMAEIGRELA